MKENKSEHKKDVFVESIFPDEDDFGYFVKYDELTGVVACPGICLPTVEESCFVSRAETFGEIDKKG